MKFKPLCIISKIHYLPSFTFKTHFLLLSPLSHQIQSHWISLNYPFQILQTIHFDFLATCSLHIIFLLLGMLIFYNLCLHHSYISFTSVFKHNLSQKPSLTTLICIFYRNFCSFSSIIRMIYFILIVCLTSNPTRI